LDLANCHKKSTAGTLDFLSISVIKILLGGLFIVYLIFQVRDFAEAFGSQRVCWSFPGVWIWALQELNFEPYPVLSEQQALLLNITIVEILIFLNDFLNMTWTQIIILGILRDCSATLGCGELSLGRTVFEKLN